MTEAAQLEAESKRTQQVEILHHFISTISDFIAGKVSPGVDFIK
jgi:hypothetical protein